MKPLDIIMFNMSGYSEWERGVSNRNYHIMKELLTFEEVGKILAVDYPPLTFKRALRNYKENVVTSLHDGTVVSRTWRDKLTKISDRLYVYSNSEFWRKPDRFAQHVKETALKVNFGDFLVWSYVPPVMEYIRTLGQKLTIFDAVDNWAEHSSYTNFKKRLAENYVYIKQNADIIFTVADDLQKLFDNQPNVFWIPNGVDLAHYQTSHVVINRDIADLPRPIIGYIGVIQERVDIDLIKFLASKNSTKSFVLIGPVWREVDERSLKEHKNIHILGYKSYDEAPAYIQQFDVGLIPHRRSSFVTSTNPMKVYEYLACGKPVVATKDAGVAMFKKNVYIADNATDFNRKLFLALEEDSDDRRAHRRKAVEEFSWHNTVGQMLDLIRKKLSY